MKLISKELENGKLWPFHLKMMNSVKDMYQSLFIEEMEEKQKIAMARLLNYLYRTQKRSLDHLQPVSTYKINHYMKIDYYSKRNLELRKRYVQKEKRDL